jgi:hypothetical protein
VLKHKSSADHLELDELLRLSVKLGLSRRKIEGVSPPLSPRVMDTLLPIAAND